MAVVLTDDVFIHVAFETEDVFDICHGIDEFLSSMRIIPPGKWRTGVRLEPSEATNVVDVRAITNLHIVSIIYYQCQLKRRPRGSHFLHRRVTLRKQSHSLYHFDGLQYTGRYIICRVNRKRQ